MAKKKNSANYRISGTPSTSSSILPLALSSNEHMTISTLETWLWDAACAIRGATDAPKFKDFILPLIFYKRLSDVFDDECQQYIDHFGDEELARQFIQEDHRQAQSVIENIDTLRQLFAAWMKELAPQYLPYAHAQDDKALEKTYQYFLDDKERRETFLTFFRRLQSLYEVLSPSPFLRPYLEDYQALADLYVLVRRDIDDISPDKELTRKTRELLRTHTTSSPLELPGAIRELGPEQLTMLKQSNVSDTIKMLNLRKLLNVTVEERAKYEPHVILIGERAEAVAKAYEERHIATQEALESYEKLAEQYVHAHEERQKLGLDANAFAIYLQLKQTVPEATAPQAKVINEAFSLYPDYQWNEQQKVKLRADLYKILYPLCGVVQSVAIASKLLELERL